MTPADGTRTTRRWRNRLIALVQLVTAPLVLVIFVVAEPGMIAEWPGYVGRCCACVIDGRFR